MTDPQREELTVEEMSRAFLEMIAMARCWAQPDRTNVVNAQNEVVSGMELPAHAYLSAAARLMAVMAELLATGTNVGSTQRDVLDEVMRLIVRNAPNR